MLTAFLLAAFASVPKATAIDPASWFSADDYPVEAQAKGIEGDSHFEVDVDAQGRPTACRITRPSGSAVLDQTTCDIVLKKGQFKPATSHHKPVAGHYSQTASWKLAGIARSARGYLAMILDFTGDSQHPTCSTLGAGLPAFATCEQVVGTLGPLGARENLTKLVALVSITTGAQQPYPGDPSWGRRLAFIAIDLFPPTEGSKARCSVVANEGPAPEADPCGRFTDAVTFSDAEKRSIQKAHFEQSLFGVQKHSPVQSKCKQGESAAEVRSCV